jgi:predicted phosphodiesterase
MSPASHETDSTGQKTASTDGPPSGRRSRIRISPRLKAHIKSAVILLAVCLAGLAGSAFMVYGYGESSYRWRGLDVHVRLVPSFRGETRFVFTPLGEVRAATHRTPVALSISLNEVSFEELTRFLKSPPHRTELEAEFKQQARKALTDFAARQVLLGMAGALLVPLLLRMKRARFYTLPALSGGAFVAIVIFHAAGTFNPRAYNNPTYTGSLQQANWIIGLVKDGFMRAEVLSDRLKRVAGNLNTLYGRIQSIPGMGADADTIKVLHISDIHNNPAAVGFVKELADKMKVDVVIDTGDLTDLGLPIESSLTRGMAELKVPYLFVAGNHDSQSTVRALRTNRNAMILGEAPTDAAGLRIIGSPDPSSVRLGQGSVDTPPGLLKAASDSLLDAFHRLPTPPDIVCVHNPKQAAPLIGSAKLILTGHLHAASIDTMNGTVICNAGTTGGAGIRYFDRREGVAFSAAILFFSRTEHPRLLYIDRVSLAGNLGEYSLTRKSFEPIDEPVIVAPPP